MTVEAGVRATSGLLVGGTWRQGRAGHQSVIDPGRGEIVGQVQLADARDVDDALAAASTAFETWSRTDPQHRSEILQGAAEILNSRADRVATELVYEAGKMTAEARHEVTRAVQALQWNGQEAARISGKRFAKPDGGNRTTVPAPLGVVIAVTAWNFPAVLIARKLGAALAAGCTVILKASERCPATAVAVVQALSDAGLPAGAVNLLFGDPPAVVSRLLRAPVTRALTFTGSTAVGRGLATIAAERLVRCVLELGGNAPVVVCEDADPAAVVSMTGPARYGSAGQSCVAPSRFIVHQGRYRDLCEHLVTQARSLRLGHGSDPDVTMGPVASQQRVDALLELVRDAVQRGARLLHGGRQAARPGFFLEPTILADVPPDAAVLAEEPFGPVTAVSPCAGFDEAIRMANASRYAFAAYLFTDSSARQLAATARLRASNIGINQMAASPPDIGLGGMDDSGYGYEGGTSGIEAFLHHKLVSTAAQEVS